MSRAQVALPLICHRCGRCAARYGRAADRRHVAHTTQWPGGRHSNDHVDFRQISIVPTVDELSPSQDPFLPRVDRVETFLAEDKQTQLLDRQFRLLREDMIRSVRDALGKGVTFYLPVALLGLEDHGYRRRVRDQRRDRDQRQDGDDTLKMEMGYQRLRACHVLSCGQHRRSAWMWEKLCRLGACACDPRGNPRNATRGVLHEPRARPILVPPSSSRHTVFLSASPVPWSDLNSLQRL